MTAAVVRSASAVTSPVDTAAPDAARALVACRHARVPLSGICYGRRDVEPAISPAEAADAIERALGLVRPRIVWSSSLSRCSLPAAELARRLGARHATDDRLLEIAYGEWEGRSWSELERDAAADYAAWMNDWEHRGPPGGESAVDVERRVRSWWSALSPAHAHLLVAHAGVVRALRVVTRSASWIEAMSADTPHLEAEVFPLPDLAV